MSARILNRLLNLLALSPLTSSRSGWSFRRLVPIILLMFWGCSYIIEAYYSDEQAHQLVSACDEEEVEEEIEGALERGFGPPPDATFQQSSRLKSTRFCPPRLRTERYILTTAPAFHAKPGSPAWLPPLLI